jgi:hypothetical protein
MSVVERAVVALKLKINKRIRTRIRKPENDSQKHEEPHQRPETRQVQNGVKSVNGLFAAALDRSAQSGDAK